MNVIIAGSTGMIGSLIIEHCIKSEEIKSITNLIRQTKKEALNPKISNLVVTDFATYDNQNLAFKNIDVAFFCLGVYTGQVKDNVFKQITVDYAVGFAKILKANSPNARLCLLSGAGADRTEKSRTAFARYKGMAENQISKLGLEFYSFRPGYIYPVTPRKEPNVLYKLFRYLYPLVKLMGSSASIKSTELANVMYQIGIKGADEEILENKDIIKLVN